MIYESEEGLIKETVPRKAKYFLAAVALVFLGIVSFFAYHLFVGPFQFKISVDTKLGGVVIEVEPGLGASALGGSLKDAGVVSSRQIFNLVAALKGDTKRMVAGHYLFKSPAGILEVEGRIAKGDFGLPLEKLTFPEGFTVRQVAERLEANLSFFNKVKFLAVASTSEGYLFPDTYFFLPNDDEAAIYKKMRDVYAEKAAGLFGSSTQSESDIIKMASVLEKEVRSPEDMKMVSGIFWRRMKAGIALQADATLAYERGKTSAELTAEDLKKDSPYNSYTRRGLPPTPICNPGLNAINAALLPEDSPYLYFLTDKDGKVYYAKTFEEHKKNKTRYLK